MQGLTAEALFPAFLTMTEDQRTVFLKMGHAIEKKKDNHLPRPGSVKPKQKYSIYDSVCAVLGEAFRPGNEEMLVSQIMHTIE